MKLMLAVTCCPRSSFLSLWSMKTAPVILLLTLLAACAGSRPQVLLITDYGYSLNGTSAVKLEQLNKTLRLDAPIAIEACSCADAKFVIAVTEWLQGRGVKEVSMRTISGVEPKCGVCK